MISPARTATYDILRRLATGRADLATAVPQVRDALKDERDRALATDIAVGTVRWRATLDYLIAHGARRPLDKLDDEVVDILRLSAYQLLHLTRVPASAVVDDAVDLTKKVGKKSASGLVNAVLRALSRGRGALPLPPRPSDTRDRSATLDYLSVTLSHPRWLVARWLDRVGFERTEAWLRFNNAPAPLTLRVNCARTTREALTMRLAEFGVDARAATYAPDGLVVDRGSVRDETGLGEFLVQDEASQLVALLVGTTPGPLVLDTCAAPGGKATAIAATLRETERLIACERRARRVALLRRTAAETGAVNICIVQTDATTPLPFLPNFSTVLVDAPCSGLGTLRRDPDIRWRRTAADLPTLATTQRSMLAQAAEMVRPGGRLVYATCSSEPEENESVTDDFLRHHPAFVPVPAGTAHPAIVSDLVDSEGHLRTEPDRHGLELFFGAVFERSVHL
jgi:16S rRNA (cytosine967-C5)-methyltransferase